MIIFPAIDMRQGRCVRLVEGKVENETVYADDPSEMALKWESYGAKMLHLVDLDGAFAGEPKNLAAVKKILERIKIPAQLGGGIRDIETIEMYLGMGVHRVILGTVAFARPELVREACNRFGDRIVAGIDGREGKVAIHGWGDVVEKSVVDLALEMKELGIKRVIFTDIRRDGKLTGPNIESTKELAQQTGLTIIASGGVSTLDDIKAVKAIEEFGIEGVIVGKALYDGRVKLDEALALQ